MSSNRQRRRSAVGAQEQRALAGWTQLFPAKQETEQQSLTFVKKLVSAFMSTVTYVRNIFDLEAYTKMYLGGTPHMILNSTTSCDKARVFNEWLLGAFEAIEKKYLREMSLMIYLDAARPEEVAEVYTVKVSYPGGLPSCKVSGVSGLVQGSTRDLLQAILAHTQGLPALPATAFLALRLQYYDEVTPPDYEPTGFAATELQLPLGRTAEVGRVATAHHALAFRVHDPNLASEGAAALINDAYTSQSQSSNSASLPTTSQADTPAFAAAPRPKAASLPSTSRTAATNHSSPQDLDNPLPDVSQTRQDVKDPEAAEGEA